MTSGHLCAHFIASEPKVKLKNRKDSNLEVEDDGEKINFYAESGAFRGAKARLRLPSLGVSRFSPIGDRAFCVNLQIVGCRE